MRIAIYITGILGGVLFIGGLIGFVIRLSHHLLFLYMGLGLIFLGCIPLALIDKYLREKNWKKIIESHKNNKKEIDNKNGNTNRRGWNMNNSPFRERKSGLTWGGGNIKGATAKRGNKRSFLR